MSSLLIYYNQNALKPEGGPGGYLYSLKKGLEMIPTKSKDINFLDIKPGRMKTDIEAMNLTMIKKLQRIHGKLHNIKEFRNFDKAKAMPMVDLDNYDAVHFHSTLDLFLLRETLKYYRGKVILTSHSPQPLSQEITDKFNSFEKVLVGEKAINDFIMFDKYAFERADYVIFPCEDAEEPYIKRWPDFIKIKHQSPNKFKYCLTGTIRAEAKIPRSDIRTKYKIPDDAFVLCFVGRHNKIKGYDRFIRIAENLMQKDENIYALVAGDPGPVPSPQQKRWIEVGWTNDPHSIINASDIFLLPNEETYFDMVLLEVLSLGVPIVTTNTGGNKYFGDKYEPGISLFDTDDQCENIIRRIKFMSIGELNTIKEKNQAFYNENFTPKAFAERYVKVIFYITSLGGGVQRKSLLSF